MAERYLVTGAWGCIGSWVVKTLIERGDEPVVLVHSRDDYRVRYLLPCDTVDGISVHRGDIASREDVQAAVEMSGAQKIIHLAGMQTPACHVDPVRGSMVNVTGTINVFLAAIDAGVKRVAYASSAAVYGPGTTAYAVKESDPCVPSSQYGVFKVANEDSARLFHDHHGLDSVGLRPFVVYGVGRDRGMTSGPTKAIATVLQGGKYEIGFSGPTDFQYVADVALAFIEAVDNAPSGAHILNMHGQTMDVRDFVAMIDKLLPAEKRGRIRCAGDPLEIAPILDDGLLRSMLPRIPRTGPAEALRETIHRITALLETGRMRMADEEAD